MKTIEVVLDTTQLSCGLLAKRCESYKDVMMVKKIFFLFIQQMFSDRVPQAINCSDYFLKRHRYLLTLFLLFLVHLLLATETGYRARWTFGLT